MTLVPRPCAVRQELEAWGQQQLDLPLFVEKPGRTTDEACRRWHEQSVIQSVEVEDSDGRVTQEERRFIVVHSSQLAQQHTQTYASAQGKEAKAITDHRQRVQARWFACEADAEAAIAEYEPQGLGHRGRRPRPWRYHAVHYRVVADTRRTHRARRGRPAKTDPPPLESGYRLVVAVEALANPEEDNGWMVLATTVHAEVCSATDILQAYQDQNTTPWSLVFVGSRPPRLSLPCGSRNLNGLRPWRCAPSSACWSTASSSDRSASIYVPMTTRAQGTKARQRSQRRWGWHYLPKWP